MTHSNTAPTLAAESRTLTGKKVSQLRAQGMLPAVVYGHNKESIALSIDAKTFEKLYHTAGQTTLIALSIDGKAPFKVLVNDVQVDPIRHTINHADLYQVNLKEKLTTEVPLTFSGVSDAVEVEGGILNTIKNEVEIECLPDDLIHEIIVDISALKTFEDTICVSDLQVPAGITIVTDAEQIIASVSEPISEEELAELDEAPVAENATEFETKSGTEAPAEGEEATE